MTGMEEIAEGTHDRVIIYPEKFNQKVEEKKRSFFG